MTEFCEKCGQPIEICVCSEIQREAHKIRVRVERRKFKKMITLITGIEGKEHIESIGKELKKKLACGGTSKNGMVELQGRHPEKVKAELMKIGFKESSIILKGDLNSR